MREREGDREAEIQREAERKVGYFHQFLRHVFELGYIIYTVLATSFTPYWLHHLHCIGYAIYAMFLLYRDRRKYGITMSPMIIQGIVLSFVEIERFKSRNPLKV